MNNKLTDERIAHFIEGVSQYERLYPGADNGNPFPPSEILAVFMELQEYRKASKLSVTDSFLDELDTLIDLCRTYSMFSGESHAPRTERRCLDAMKKIAAIRVTGTVEGSQ